MAVLRKGSETKASALSAESSLSPLVLVRVQASALLETSLDLLIEVGNSISVEAGRHSPYGEDHFAERRTLAKELQCNLRVWELAQSLQDTSCLVKNSLRH